MRESIVWEMEQNHFEVVQGKSLGIKRNACGCPRRIREGIDNQVVKGVGAQERERRQEQIDQPVGNL